MERVMNLSFPNISNLSNLSLVKLRPNTNHAIVVGTSLGACVMWNTREYWRPYLDSVGTHLQSKVRTFVRYGKGIGRSILHFTNMKQRETVNDKIIHPIFFTDSSMNSIVETHMDPNYSDYTDHPIIRSVDTPTPTATATATANTTTTDPTTNTNTTLTINTKPSS